MKKFKSIITLTLLSGILFFSSCDKDDDPVSEPMPENTSIAAIASANDDFSILVEALVKTDLVNTLDGEGSFTVFAPDNNAFSALFTKLGVSGIQDISG